MRRLRRCDGFSLVEIMVASALLLVVMGGVFQALHPAYGAFQAEPERADVQQRLRAGLSAIVETVANAGAGLDAGPAAGPLVDRIAAVFPYRLGRRNPDAPGTARADAITVLQVERGAARTTLALPLPARSGDAVIALDPGCPMADPSCGFARGMTALVVGPDGRFDLFNVAAVNGSTITLEHNTADSPFTYPAGSVIAQARTRTLYLGANRSTGEFQLMRYDGDNGNDVPIVDHVVGLAFAYRGDGAPPQIVPSPVGTAEPWTSYGPPPPDDDVMTTAYSPGENCTFLRDGASAPLPRLGVLGADLVDLPLSIFTDGPWCADGADPNRFDADLLRVRTIVITLRIEAAAAAFRGAIGPTFVNAGTARSALHLVPDAQVTIQVTPMNLGSRR